MKQTTLIVLSAIIAFVVGVTGISVYADNASQPELSDMEQLAVDSGLYGHLEVVQKNAAGEIIAYRQTDNVVTTEGKDCAVEILFNGAAGLSGNGCPMADQTDYNFNAIELISSGTPVAGDVQGTTAGVEITGVSGLAIADGVCTVADAAGSGSVTCSKTFTAGTGVSAQTVSGAYLKLGSGGVAVFAGNTFTSVSMSDSDTLAVTWTLTLS